MLNNNVVILFLLWIKTDDWAVCIRSQDIYFTKLIFIHVNIKFPPLAPFTGWRQVFHSSNYTWDLYLCFSPPSRPHSYIHLILCQVNVYAQFFHTFFVAGRWHILTMENEILINSFMKVINFIYSLPKFCDSFKTEKAIKSKRDELSNSQTMDEWVGQFGVLNFQCTCCTWLYCGAN